MAETTIILIEIATSYGETKIILQKHQFEVWNIKNLLRFITVFAAMWGFKEWCGTQD